MLRKFTSAIFIVTLLAQCNNKNADTSKEEIKINFTIPDLNLSSPSIQHPVSYNGDWNYNFPFYSSLLHIDKDGSFTFHERGCAGHGYSEGRWTTDKRDILLTSSDSYSSPKDLKIIEIKQETISFEHQKNKTGYTFDPSSLNVTFEYNASPNDTSNVYFNNVRLRLEGDTLYRLNEHGLQTDAKFVLSRSNQ